ncbi:Antitoxin component of toxin-antitoxin stability system, DNA-binding transcriptional repressor [Granulicella rosea]|uniref:Antitoxin component of toxin-antitoxin stability system, DNA-binding transcriptional repressor n=1 Tax=Granulicella rosea TaxID=474952 RepID=A0A239MB62_9BACT|nr:hypothetical protein [Granulicella rosea]SNT39976.1 Antitoxin component of toxin-antitoxin stability system, DNA-binding transcriptional repressor [Granulicella rosea]
MRDVNVIDLQNELSTYLDFAKSGEVVVIHDDHLPVARLILFPPEMTGDDAALVASGVMTLPEKPFDIDELLSLPETTFIGNAGTQAILDERNEGW